MTKWTAELPSKTDGPFDQLKRCVEAGMYDDLLEADFAEKDTKNEQKESE